ncbi:MAG: hypothetical protein WA820_21730, partial [Bradyrhizobium sp.]
MTVIAALHLAGIPALIGDFLITETDRRRPHFQLPTLQDMSKPFGSECPLQIAGIRRKCLIVNDRFAVAFTGHVAAGKRVFARLAERFGSSSTGPSLRDLDDVLQPFNRLFPRRRLAARVIGWTVRSRAVCFSWSAGRGRHVEQSWGLVEGSGRKSFRESLTEPKVRVRGTPIATAYEGAVLLAVLKTGRVLSDELLTSQNLEIGYGFGAEAALFSGRKFQFVRKIGYLFCNIVIEKSGLITLRPANRAVIYEAKGKFAVSSFIQFDHDTVQLRSAKRYLALLPALHDAEVSAHVDEPDFLCPYYFCGFVVLDARSGN